MMAVFRIEKNRDYTVMSNHHLRNAGLSLKSKGLLSMMLSLPEDWNYTTRGLAKICKEGTDSIGSALKELERAGYIVRNRLRDSKGKIVDVEYVIYETPHPPDTGQPCEDEPDTACPDTENPDMDNPCLENRPQLNKEKRNPEKQNTDSPSAEGSNPIQSSPQSPAGANRTGRDWMRERESYRELILENIEYDILVQNERMDRDRLNELVELILFPQGDDSHCRGRLSGGGGQIPISEAEQFPYRVCAGLDAGQHHLCPQYQEISAGCPV